MAACVGIRCLAPSAGLEEHVAALMFHAGDQSPFKLLSLLPRQLHPPSSAKATDSSNRHVSAPRGQAKMRQAEGSALPASLHGTRRTRHSANSSETVSQGIVPGAWRHGLPEARMALIAPPECRHGMCCCKVLPKSQQSKPVTLLQWGRMEPQAAMTELSTRHATGRGGREVLSPASRLVAECILGRCQVAKRLP